MTTKKNIYFLYLLILLEFIVIYKSKIVINSVMDSSLMFILKIFPSLFPTMVIGNLLVKENVQLIIPKFIKKIFKKLYGYNDTMTGIFIISMFTGTPSNAMYINEYLEKGLLNEKQAVTLLCTTHFINPLFVIGGVGIGVFKSAKIGFLLLIVLWLNNFIKAFICRSKWEKDKNNELENNPLKFISDLSYVIKKSINSLLMIFGIVIMFNLLTTLIKNVFYLNGVSSTIINGILEMTGGTAALSKLNVNKIIKIIISYVFLNFGGFCIHMQTMSMMENKKIRYFKYLIFRLF